MYLLIQFNVLKCSFVLKKRNLARNIFSSFRWCRHNKINWKSGKNVLKKKNSKEKRERDNPPNTCTCPGNSGAAVGRAWRTLTYLNGLSQPHLECLSFFCPLAHEHHFSTCILSCVLGGLISGLSLSQCSQQICHHSSLSLLLWDCVTPVKSPLAPSSFSFMRQFCSCCSWIHEGSLLYLPNYSCHSLTISQVIFFFFKLNLSMYLDF